MSLQNRNFPNGTEAVIQALQVCKSLHQNQIKAILRHYNENLVDRSFKQLVQSQLIFSHASGFVTLTPKPVTIERTTIAAFWVFLAYFEKANLAFSKGRYPANIVFTIGNDHYEIVSVPADGNAEVGHIAVREPLKVATKMILVFLSEESKKQFNRTILPNIPCLIAVVEAPPTEDNPNVYYEKL